MTTTRYITADGIGVLSLIARAVDPNGNPITQQVSITTNPLPELPKCYNAIIALSTVQQDISSACAQFGVANTYYLGNPKNTVYKTDSCSEIADDGFYKTEDGNWVNVNGGSILQRGSCNTVDVRNAPQRFEGVPAVPVSLPGGQSMEVFVPKPVFTAPSPSLVPPQTNIVSQREATQPKTPSATLSGTGIRIKETAPIDPIQLIARAQSLGIAVSSDVVRGGLRPATKEYTILRRLVQSEIDKREQSVG
jgi:hypothetical protein